MCASEMRIISFIYQKTVIQKIITHLQIDEKPHEQRGPPKIKLEYTEQSQAVVYDDGWPCYEEPNFKG